MRSSSVSRCVVCAVLVPLPRTVQSKQWDAIKQLTIGDSLWLGQTHTHTLSFIHTEGDEEEVGQYADPQACEWVTLPHD